MQHVEADTSHCCSWSAVEGLPLKAAQEKTVNVRHGWYLQFGIREYNCFIDTTHLRRVLANSHLIVYSTTAGGKCGSVLGLMMSSEKRGNRSRCKLCTYSHGLNMHTHTQTHTLPGDHCSICPRSPLSNWGTNDIIRMCIYMKAVQGTGWS